MNIQLFKNIAKRLPILSNIISERDNLHSEVIALKRKINQTAPGHFRSPLPSLASIKSHLKSPLQVFDIGARWGNFGDWADLGERVIITGFEPDPDECARLNHAAPSNVTYVPLALGAVAENAELHITRDPACSSLYPPMLDLAASVPGLTCITPQSIEPVKITPIDSWISANIRPLPDVIKIDTQGSELDILRGAEASLGQVELLEIEVEFNPIYEGQPLFADVDTFLRARGFVLWRFGTIVHYTDGTFVDNALDTLVISHADDTTTQSVIGRGQVYWADAWFVRADLGLGGTSHISADRAIKIAAAALGCGLPDLAGRALNLGGLKNLITAQ